MYNDSRPFFWSYLDNVGCKLLKKKKLACFGDYIIYFLESGNQSCIFLGSPVHKVFVVSLYIG